LLGPHLLGWALRLAASTVHAILARHGRSRLHERPARAEVVRDKRERPGELLPLDLKKMGRIPVPGHRVTGDRSRRASQGGLALPVRRDRRRDPTRLGFAPLYPAASTECALAFLDACRRFYAGHGIRIERMLTDNGTCFKRRWQAGCEARGILVRRTRFRRPQTNGKVERFIRTLLELWAHQRPYPHERERTQALAPALDSYNRLRRHAPSEA